MRIKKTPEEWDANKSKDFICSLQMPSLYCFYRIVPSCVCNHDNFVKKKKKNSVYTTLLSPNERQKLSKIYRVFI